MLTDQGKNIRIIKLPETDEIQPGYYVPVDSVVDGTKKFDLSGLTTAIEGKADASEIECLQEEIASKAGPEEIEALEIEIEEKASHDDLVNLSGTVDQLEDDVSTAQEDITALQTAVEDLQIIPDTSTASSGDFLSFDGTGLEWTKIPDMKILAGTDIKVEGNVVSVNTNGTASGEYSFVEGLNTYAGGPFDHVEGVGGVSDGGGTNHVEGFQYHLYTSNELASSFHGSNVVKFQNQPLTNRQGNSLGYGDLYKFVKLFKDRFKVSCEYNTNTEIHYTENEFFRPSLYDITDISLDDTDIVLTLDRELVCPSSSGTLKLYGPIHVMSIMGGGGSLQSGEVLNTFRTFLGFPGNNTETVRPDNAFIGISMNYTKPGDSDTTHESKILEILSIEYSNYQYNITTEDVIVPEITGGRYSITIYVIDSITYGCNHIEGQDNFVYGVANSHAEGFYNTVTESCSHAEGSHNLVESQYSHAEGYKSSVIYDLDDDNGGSHAEGYQTSACVIGSHSEGYNTYAKGAGAHSEGYKTVANASRSHAEGYESRATGSNSHAEGYKTLANGDNSHSEGESTSAYSYQTHAEGLRTYAGATAAHSEGWDTSAMAPGTHAEGKSTYVSGTNAHAEGQYTKATGNYSHVEGAETSAFGSGGHAEGYKTYSNYEYSHAEGNGSRAENSSSHAEGQNTVASAIASHAEGYNTRAASSYAHAEGENTKANGTAAHAEGNGTIAAGGFSHAEGLNTKATGDCSHATGIGTEALAYAFACGKYNEVNSNDLFTIGNGSNDSNKSTCFRVDKDGKVWFIYNGVLTDLATTVVPSSTAADSGKVLMVASDGTTSYKDLITAQHTYDSTNFPQQTPQVQFSKAKMSGGTPGSDQVLDIVQATMKSSDGQSTAVIGGLLVPSISSAGVLQNWSDSSGGHYGWKPVNEVPSSTASDSGKVLSVDSNGTAAWGNAVGFVKNAGPLTDGATITATTLNNGFATLSTSQSALTIIDVVGTDEIVNFAIEIEPSVNCTLTIQKKVGTNSPVTLKHSVAAGNTLEAGKTYQVTAVGNCWTLAEFEA
jgi:hypothetical protein